MKDDLGKRMKEHFEERTRYQLPRRTYTIIRLDGKAFHSFTKGMKRPYDENLIKLMDMTTLYLCKNIQGCKFGYVQSDEISLLLTDFETITTDAWFDSNIQKMCSISSSLATGIFNQLFLANTCANDKFDNVLENFMNQKLAFFDSRVFTIPDFIEVENYFVWRQKDAVRNSIQMLGQNLYSHKELNCKSSNEIQEMCFQKGKNWNDLPDGFKRGRLISKDIEGEFKTWKVNDSFDFLKEREKLTNLIPKISC